VYATFYRTNNAGIRVEAYLLYGCDGSNLSFYQRHIRQQACAVLTGLLLDAGLDNKRQYAAGCRVVRLQCLPPHLPYAFQSGMTFPTGRHVNSFHCPTTYAPTTFYELLLRDDMARRNIPAGTRNMTIVWPTRAVLTLLVYWRGLCIPGWRRPVTAACLRTYWFAKTTYSLPRI